MSWGWWNVLSAWTTAFERMWGGGNGVLLGGVVVLGEECEPGFEGCLGSGVGQGEEVCLSGGFKDVVVEEEAFEFGGEAEYGCICFA